MRWPWLIALLPFGGVLVALWTLIVWRRGKRQDGLSIAMTAERRAMVIDLECRQQQAMFLEAETRRPQ